MHIDVGKKYHARQTEEEERLALPAAGLLLPCPEAATPPPAEAAEVAALAAEHPWGAAKGAETEADDSLPDGGAQGWAGDVGIKIDVIMGDKEW